MMAISCVLRLPVSEGRREVNGRRMQCSVRSKERGARSKEDGSTRRKITSDEECSEGCCGLTGPPMY